MRKKTRRDFIKTIGIAAAGTGILSASHFKCSKGEKHPNVILISLLIIIKTSHFLHMFLIMFVILPIRYQINISINIKKKV